jgi:hypothetical protein
MRLRVGGGGAGSVGVEETEKAAQNTWRVKKRKDGGLQHPLRQELRGSRFSN